MVGSVFLIFLIFLLDFVYNLLKNIRFFIKKLKKTLPILLMKTAVFHYILQGLVAWVGFKQTLPGSPNP